MGVNPEVNQKVGISDLTSKLESAPPRKSSRKSRGSSSSVTELSNLGSLDSKPPGTSSRLATSHDMSSLDSAPKTGNTASFNSSELDSKPGSSAVGGSSLVDSSDVSGLTSGPSGASSG